ncbi:hypothetical protein, partial [Bacillus amyloliquefaciens]|uniref:hypothetical protein n=1 Tax=Bacillus amyloliquefaciens TaxID=1390 RepID=UPI0037D21ECF
AEEQRDKHIAAIVIRFVQIFFFSPGELESLCRTCNFGTKNSRCFLFANNDTRKTQMLNTVYVRSNPLTWQA